jgi:hypothetical protein
LTTIIVVAGCLKSEEKDQTSGFPREFDNYPESLLWEKLLFLYHSALGVPTGGILKNRVAAITVAATPP